jgi:1-deoxy-D-xylulose-5-phosphate synthase
MEAYPERAFDVGIAEQHAVTLAAGMATQGLVPFCNIYSTFLQRAYDQVIHDVALQSLPVIFCLDRAGLVGQDGATHHGTFDLAFLNCIPDIIIAAPMDAVELRNIMFTAQLGLDRPTAIRYPRGRGHLVEWQLPFEQMEIGKARKLSQGNRIAVLSIGTLGVMVQELIASENLEITHIDIRFLKPMDLSMILKTINTHDHIITIEDGTILGGLGSTVGDLAFAKAKKPLPQLHKLGIPDSFIQQGPTADLHRIAGIDRETLLELITRLQ